MAKVVDYKVIDKGDDTIGFVVAVKEAIKSGWVPLGGVATDQYGMHWLQAMVKYE